MFQRICCLVITVAMVGHARALRAQQPDEDARTQYPRLLIDSYASLSVGAVDYLFSPRLLQPGFQVATVDTPHLTVRVALFGHEFNRFIAVQGSYMRPVQFISYRNVNGAGGTDHHHVRVNFGSVTLKTSAPIATRLAIYGEGGLGFTSRTGFAIRGAPAVTDAHFASLLVGAGIDYQLNENWTVTTGMTYSPPKASVAQPRTIFTSGGFRYTMRRLPDVQNEANGENAAIFPHHLVQIEYSSGVGYSVNEFVSTKVPIFWGGNAKVDIGVAPHYERNVFHTVGSSPWTSGRARACT